MGGPERGNNSEGGPTPRYFTQHDLLKRYPDLLPRGVAWPEMIGQGKAYSPAVVRRALSQASVFLSTEPGPHLSERQVMAEDMFPYWDCFLRKLNPVEGDFVACPALRPFEEVYSLPEIERARVVFGAGFEGHFGHVWTAQWLKKPKSMFCDGQKVLGSGPTILALEQESYFTDPEAGKTRTEPFLPLPLRLSMWGLWGFDAVTVIPEKPAQAKTGPFHDEVFRKLVGGKDRGFCFTAADDPFRVEKILRGRGKRLSEFERDFVLTVRSVPTPSTTARVKCFLPDDSGAGDDFAHDFSELERMQKWLKRLIESWRRC